MASCLTGHAAGGAMASAVFLCIGHCGCCLVRRVQVDDGTASCDLPVVIVHQQGTGVVQQRA